MIMKKAAFAFAAVALLGAGALAGCDTVKEQTGVEFVNPYKGVTGFQNQAYVTIRLYEASLDSAIYACDKSVNPDAAKTPKVVCDKAAAAAAKISPAVQAVAHSLGTYVYLDSKVQELNADGKIVPAEVLGAAADAFYKAQSEWAVVEKDINEFLGRK